MTNGRLDRLAEGSFLDMAPRLEPDGTARLRFLRSQPHGPGDLGAELYARARALDLSPALVDAARYIADLAPAETPAGTRVALLRLVLVVLLDARMGSTRTPILDDVGQRHLFARLETLLGHLKAESAPDDIAALIRETVPGVLAPIDDRDHPPATPLLVDGDSVATHRLYVLERRVIIALAQRTSTTAVRPSDRVARALASVQAQPAQRNGTPAPLTDEQATAVAKAAQLALTVISGGPGTGKTSIVVGLVRTLVRLGVSATRILIAAPTGKAANRSTEALRSGFESLGPSRDEVDEQAVHDLPPAETLHRLLGYRSRQARFARNQDDPLAADVVIVDEASMIDLRLMDALLQGVPPRAQLVLLGDADQLPSVDAGAILRDLRAFDPRGRFSVQLTHSFRMDAEDPRGAQILTAARAIQAGRVAPGAVSARPQQLTFSGFEQLSSNEVDARRRFLDVWVDRHLSSRTYQRAARRILHHRDGAFRADDVRALQRLTEHLSSFKLLAVTRSAALPTGADALNQAIHDRLVAQAAGPDSGPLGGEPVMMLRNDYERGLFNGDVGVAMQVAVDQRAASPMVVFATAQGYEPFPLAVLQQDLTLAHAMTVHKAQGSEFDEVAVVLPEIDVPVLTKEVLYTGLTRARTSVVLVGTPALTSRVVARPVVRYSGLATGLRAAADDGDHDREE